MAYWSSTFLIGVAASNGALFTFVVYTLGVFGIAWAANRLLRSRHFVSEYFLGSRSLGMWAFALTFAATSASGGSFTGFPAKIYTHGWILALWIASYMVVPLCTMGILGKRINQVARKSGAITVPDVLRDRFNSRTFGLIATLLIVFFMSFNLVAQFKAGSLILKTLMADVPLFKATVAGLHGWSEGSAGVSLDFLRASAGEPVDWAYLVCLLSFGVAVVLYTTYGGFHAVVWTDVMQGIVMVLGVLVMLPLALYQVGGLQSATEEMATLKPPLSVEIEVTWSVGESPSDQLLPSGSWLLATDEEGPARLFRTTTATRHDPSGAPVSVEALEIISPGQIEQVRQVDGETIHNVTLVGQTRSEEYSYGALPEQTGAYVQGPGPSRADTDGFLPLGVAISFFFMWAISGTGQPNHMVRLMAFRDARTLRRAIITVTLYYGMIYFPLVIIFCCARILLPGLENEPDSIMPRMAVFLTSQAGVGWLAGLLIAAPFAAVMSTVDSFLLMISSSLVRDIWQRNVNPHTSEHAIKWLSYLTTLLIGTIAMIGAVNPPRFLQDIIVYVGSGLAACFLIPVIAALYWPRSNKYGCIGGMLSGFLAHLGMHVLGMFQPGGGFVTPYLLFGFSPVVVGLASSLIGTIAFTLLTPPADDELVRKYFCAEAPSASSGGPDGVSGSGSSQPA